MSCKHETWEREHVEPLKDKNKICDEKSACSKAVQSDYA